MKNVITIIAFATAFGCSLFWQQKPDVAQLCQVGFWQSASKKDVAAIDNPNHTCSHKSIIHLATQYASAPVLHEFLQKDDVKINAKNKQGYTPLILAARFGLNEAVNIILDAGADVDRINNYGNTALSFAARFGLSDIVQSLLDCGANVNLPNNIGNTPLIRASHFGHAIVVKALIGARADVNGRNKAGQSALNLASQKGHTKVIEQLIKAGSKK